MSERAQALAERFEQMNRQLISTVESCSDEQWQAKTTAEGWSVAVTAHHIAGAHEAIAGAAQGLATGQGLPPITSEMLDEMNAKHAQEHASCTKEETVELLRRNGQTAAGIIRGFSDEQLERSAPAAIMGGAEMSTEQFVENGLIGHMRGHADSIRTTIAQHEAVPAAAEARQESVEPTAEPEPERRPWWKRLFGG
jgi:uncharacterized damage-inducible protein DinB